MVVRRRFAMLYKLGESMSTFKKKLAIAVAGGMLAISGAATAAGVFTIDPTSINGTGTQFDADFVTGASSARIQRVDSTNDYTASGWIQFGSFKLGGSVISTDITKLDSTTGYGLYATFTQTFTCPSALAVGVTCDVSTISLNVYADPGFLDTFKLATLAADPTVTDVGSNDILLATANVVIAGTAGINSLGGAFENVNTNFILTTAGSNYFIKPVPFFNVAFSNFNNSSTGLLCNTFVSAANPCPGTPSIVAVNDENGGTTFERTAIPEPGTLALIGLGVLALGFMRKRNA
jgi:hypothetical protein